MRIFYVPFDGTAVDAATDLVELKADANRSISLMGFHVGKAGPTSERIKFTITRSGSGATSGSSPSTGGGAVTPIATCSLDTLDDGFAAEALNETRISGGSPVTPFKDAIDPSLGYDYTPAREADIIKAVNSEFITVGIESAPSANNPNWAGHAVVGVE